MVVIMTPYMIDIVDIFSDNAKLILSCMTPLNEIPTDNIYHSCSHNSGLT